MRVDYSNTQKGQIAEGYYEAVIKDAGFDTTAMGKEYISVGMKIREDVEQKHMRATARHKIWKATNPTLQDDMCEGYSSVGINILSRAVGFEDGMEFERVVDWMQALIGRPVKIEIVHNEYNGKVYANVDNVEPSDYPTVKDPFGQTTGMIGVPVLEDEELPF